MLTSTQVQQMTVAMFGAAAGGYTEELSAFESQAALGDFLATLDLATEKFADATTDLAKAKIIAGDFGLAANDEAVQQVLDWLDAGASLGTIYSEAIAYLTGTPAADFADAAADLAAKVEGAVTFSAANADVTDVAALKAGVSATVADLALTAALEAISAAGDAEVAQAKAKAAYLVETYSNKFVKALTVDGADAGTDVSGADVLEATIAAAHEDAADVLVGAADATNSISEGGAAFNALGDDSQDNRIATAQADLAAKVAAADKAINDATTGTLVALKDGVAAAMAEAAAAETALEAALKAQDTQDAATSNALKAAGSVATLTTITSLTLTINAGVVTATDNVGATSVLTTVTAGAVAFDAAKAVLNADGTLYTITTANGSATVTKSYLDAVLTAAQADVDAAAVVTSAENALAAEIVTVMDLQDAAYADAATETYATLVTDGTIAVAGAAVTVSYANEAGLAGAEATKLDGYAQDLVDLAAANKEVEAFEKALAEWQGTEALVDGLKAINDEAAALAKATTAAKAAVTDAVADGGLGKALGTIGTTDADAAGGTEVDDVFVYVAGTGDAGLLNFGVEGTDSIYFGAGNFALVALGADEVVATDAVGDVATAEIFWEDTAGGLKLYVEDETFAGSSTNGATDITTIVLVGVEGADVTFENGYLSVSA